MPRGSAWWTRSAHMLRQEGMIGKKDHEFTRWVSADLTEAEKGDARNYRPGRVDMVQFFQPRQGASARLAGHGRRGGAVPAAASTKPAEFQAYRKETVQFAEGDILRFTANGMTLDGHQIRNGSAYKIAGFTAKGIRLENGWLVSNDFGHFKHGIETSHGSQSKTVKLCHRPAHPRRASPPPTASRNTWTPAGHGSRR